MNDVISRQDALETFLQYRHSVLSAEEIISLIPSAQERKTGKWIKIKEMSWECSVCKKENCYAYHYNDDLTMQVLQDFYCPNCGAEMEKGEDDE